MEHSLEITEDTLCGLRLIKLLFNGGTERLRNVFDNRVPNLQQFLKIKEADIKSLIKKKIINKSQKDKLYPPVGSPSSKNFDISLLYNLLRNICGLPSPATGWGTKPASTDRTVQGAIEMIHWYRNKYSHPSVVEVDKTSFEASWREISEAMQRLGEDASRIASLKVASLLTGNCIERLAKFDFSAEVECYSSKHHRGTREWVFSHVDSWFLDRGSDSRVLIVAGNAGMGKTVIAAKLCKKMKDQGRLGGMHFCQHNNQRRRKPELMLQSLAKHLCDSLPGFKEILTGQLASVSANELASMNIEELFTHLLQEPTNIIEDPGMNFLLLVDALDECEYDGRNRLLDVIMSQFHKLPTWIKFLVTGRPENQMAKKLEHLNPLVLDAQDENNQKDIEVFLEDSLRDILPSCDVKENVHRFVNQAEGLMLYAHYFVQFVKENKETVKPEDLSDIFPSGIASVYDQYFGRLQMNLGVENGPFCDFLASIAAARSPLPVTVAYRILGFCPDTVDGNSGQIQKISGSISTLLPIRNECIDVFHKSIVDWLSVPELYGNHRFTVDLNRGNAILSSECMKIYQAIENRHNVDVAENTTEENYALQHGTYHSTASECLEISERQRNELFRHACSLELLYAKLQSKVCDVFSIIEELQCIKSILNLPNVDSMELDDCINCLKRHPYVLMENPEMIFQFLVNEAETTAMSLEACAVMHQPPFEIPLRVEVVNRAQSKNPVTSKFRCKTYVNCCDVLKDGEHSLLVCGCKGGFIHMFSLETGRELWSYQSDDVEVWPEEERCSYCVFVPHHGAIIYGRFDSAVTFKGESMQLFPDNSHSFIDSCVSQDRKKLVTRQTHLTAALFVWELDTGNMLARLEQTTASITCCTISSCGNFVISGSFDQGVSLWDINKAPNYRCQHNPFDGDQPFIIDCLASLEGSSQHVIVNSSKKQSLTVCEINTSTCEASKTTLLHLGSTHKSLGVSSSGGLLYVCGDSQRISCDNVPFQVRIVPISSATKWEYLKEVDFERVLLRDCETVYMCQSLEKAESAVVTDRGVQAISFSVDGKHVYVLSMVGMSMYEASSGRFLRNNTNVCQANFFALSPNGEFILIQTKDAFEIYNCKLEYQWSLLDHPVAHRFFFKFIDDDRVLTLSKRGDIQVWNIAESKLFVEKLNSNNSLVECCDVFTLEKSVGDISTWHYRLLCCNRHGSLSLHDTFQSRTFTRKVPNDQIVKCCKFSPDGRFVVTGHIDGTLRIWEGSLFELKKILPPGDGMVKGCSFLVQNLGDVVVGVYESGAFKIWDVFRERVLGFMSFEGKLRGLVTSPLNAQVCVALEDKIVILNVHGPEID